MTIRRPIGDAREALPEEHFPSVGKAGDRIWRVGHCEICGLVLMQVEMFDPTPPIERRYCWEHDPGSLGRTGD